MNVNLRTETSGKENLLTVKGSELNIKIHGKIIVDFYVLTCQQFYINDWDGNVL